MSRTIKRDIVVIGASAGGVEAVSQLVGALPEDFAPTVFVTVHFPSTALSVLPRVLQRAGKLGVSHPEDGEAIKPNHVYVAPPDFHLLLLEGVIRLVRGPTENGNRPAVDPMFRSAAVSYRQRVIGVVLTGSLDDGTAGLMTITRRGGVALAQDPAEALFPSMPQSAITYANVSHVGTIAELARLLQQLSKEDVPVDDQSDPSDHAAREDAYSAFDIEVIEDPERHPGHSSPYSCPDCGGVLWQIKDDDFTRYRCRVGHAWTSDGLLLQHTETVDAALWTALRALEENAALKRQLAQRMAKRGSRAIIERLEAGAEVAERRSALIRSVLLQYRHGDAQHGGRAASSAAIVEGTAANRTGAR